MSVKTEFLEKVEAERKAIYYKFPKTGKKFKFIIKPFVADITKETTKMAMKEMGKGQTIEEASRIAAENFKKRFQDMGVDSAFKQIIERSVVFPKITEKTENTKDDELPFSYLDASMKNFIILEIKEISPIFKGK